MEHDAATQGERSQDRVSLDDERDVQYWTKRHGVTKEKLQRAIERAGPALASVEEYLDRSNTRSTK